MDESKFQLFVAAYKQEIYDFTFPRVVKPITGAVMDSHFRQSTAQRLGITEVVASGIVNT